VRDVYRIRLEFDNNRIPAADPTCTAIIEVDDCSNIVGVDIDISIVELVVHIDAHTSRIFHALEQ